MQHCGYAPEIANAETNKAQKKHYIIFAMLLVITIIRIWFANFVGNWLAFPSTRDDQWFLTVSQLRSYYLNLLDLGDKMLIKETVFPAFLCFVRISRLSFATAVSLLWVLGAALAGVLAWVALKNKIVCCFTYVFFLWTPIAFDMQAGTRIYRNAIIAPLVLCCFSLALIFLYMLLEKKLYKKRYYALTAVSLGILLFFTAYIKEDGIWLEACLIAAVILYIAVALIRFHGSKKLCASMVCISLIPLALFGSLQTAYKLLNYKCFGVYVTNTRTDGALADFVNIIYKIDSDNRTEVCWAPKDAIEKAFEASPTLQCYPELLDAIEHTPWFSGDIEANPICGDFLTWVLRDALVQCGLWTDYSDIEELFAQINTELDEAFQTGKLQKDDKFQIVASAGGKSPEEIRSVCDIMLSIIKEHILLNKQYTPGSYVIDSEAAKALGYEQYVTNTTLYYGDAYARRCEEVNMANNIIEKLFAIYRYWQIFAIFLGSAGFVGTIARLFTKKKVEIYNIWFILTLLGLAAIAFVYAFAIGWFLTWGDLINSYVVFYSSAVVPMLYLVEFFGIALFIDCIRSMRKGKATKQENAEILE